MADAIGNFGGNLKALAKAKIDPKRLLGYVEVHIEQGPVLEKKNLSVGVVRAIAGQCRMRMTFRGRAGHAGTTPMNLRHDALCAAAEFISTVESFAKRITGLVATVGEITALPGSSNVIPGEVRLSLDVRHSADTIRNRAVAALKQRAREICKKRNLKLAAEIVHQAAAVGCDQHLSNLLAKSAKHHQKQVPSLPSGAGHDAAAMSAITPVVMLFVRCQHGISHHPDESASEKDIRVAINVMNDFLQFVAYDARL